MSAFSYGRSCVFLVRKATGGAYRDYGESMRRSYWDSFRLALVCVVLLPGSALAQNTFPSSGNVGIGTTSPSSTLEVVTSYSSNPRGITVTNTSAGGGQIWLRRNVGSAVASGDMLGSLTLDGWNGSAYGLGAGGAIIRGMATENWGSSAMGGGILFTTTPNGSTAPAERMRIDQSGNVGIGTTAPQYKLSVNGTIGAKEVIITNTGWADYVFGPDYRLKPLKEIASFVQANHHLPGIPTAAEVQENGISVGEGQSKLLAKVEELTLHMIQAEERNDRLEQEIRQLRSKLWQACAMEVQRCIENRVSGSYRSGQRTAVEFVGEGITVIRHS